MGTPIKSIILALFCAFAFTGCASFPAKEKEKMAQIAYATGDSLSVGRVDLAANYNEKIKNYFGEPKKRIKVAAITRKNSKDNIVVLPANLKGKEVVVVSSEEWNKLLIENPKIKDQLDKEEKKSKDLDSQLKSLKIEQQEYYAHVEKLEHSNLFWKIMGWLGISIPTLVIIGLIVLAIFFPAALPIVLTIFKKIFDFIVGAVKNVIKAFNFVLEWVNSLKKK